MLSLFKFHFQTRLAFPLLKKLLIVQQSVDWTYSLFTILVGINTLRPQKCATCPLRSAPPALWVLKELGCRKYWVSPDWLSVRCCRSRLWSKKIWTGPPSSLSSYMYMYWYFLSSENWGIWCCSWDLLRSRGPKCNERNINWTQFPVRCAQPWRRSAGLPRRSRCRKSKLLSSSSLLPPRTRRHKTSTLFKWGCLHDNWLQVILVLRECNNWRSWRYLRLHLKCSQPEFRWGLAAWVWKSHSLSSAISALLFWDCGGRHWGCLRSIEEFYSIWYSIKCDYRGLIHKINISK